ncbi:putative siderophore transport system ATP-binding protein YusV [bioreactor metagenome]|uniref:Putative siderophore transport system ATP-binding protein YusV n=1 Tax=bioreactor metagenome TaxID=1076179 RepID=A0A644TM48_9ZZZZ|nr:ABC transporter ATP-binding protein [Negativicutes bacterium]
MLEASHLSIGFGTQALFNDFCLTIKDGEILSIIGPNGSGKSTLLKALARNIKPQNGAILLDNKALHSYSPVALARLMAVLPQSTSAPGDITVRSLVEYGRFPHQHWWKNTRKEDSLALDWALEQTKLMGLSDRLVSTLSGGERQRVWLAMALAQKPRILLLDEPTTYLDISHQLEILDLITALNRTEGITVVMVLHDMNHAARYSDRIAVLKKGSLFAVGTPEQVIDVDTLREVFHVEADIWRDRNNRPVCIPRCLSAATAQPTMATEKGFVYDPD